MSKLYIHYDPLSNNAWSDGDTERRAREWARALESTTTDIHINVANELSVLMFRVLVKEKVIDHNHIVFISNKIEYKLNKDGRFVNYNPTSVVNELLMRLL